MVADLLEIDKHGSSNEDVSMFSKRIRKTHAY